MPRHYHYRTRQQHAQRALVAAQHAAAVKQVSDIATIEENVTVDVTTINETLTAVDVALDTVNSTLVTVNETLVEVENRLQTLENA